jgi:hypothetical protein
MILKLYKNLSEKNVVDKNIDELAVISGTLREDCSIINPVIQIEDTAGFDLKITNYAYIEEFGRFYYINNIVCKGQLFELNMHVDVLKTHANGIRANEAVISRQQNNYNLYLQDGVFKTYAYPHIQIKQFPNGFDRYNFVFSVAG